MNALLLLWLRVPPSTASAHNLLSECIHSFLCCVDLLPAEIVLLLFQVTACISMHIHPLLPTPSAP